MRFVVEDRVHRCESYVKAKRPYLVHCKLLNCVCTSQPIELFAARFGGLEESESDNIIFFLVIPGFTKYS